MNTTGEVRSSNVRRLGLLAVLVIALAVPVLIGDNQHTLLLALTVVMYAALATAWNIIGGMGGQLDFAAGAYLGLGAFTSGTLLIRWNVTPWIGMLLGGLLAAAFSALIGYPLFLFRVREVWYSISSVALVEVLRATFLLWDDVGGPIERYLPFYSESLTRSLYILRFRTYVPYYYLVLAILLIALYANVRIKNSRLGYYLVALGENEDAAEVLGVDARACKLRALMIYAFLCGIIGTVYAALYGHISPMFFSTPLSTEVAILGIVGGMGIIHGPLVAAVIMVSLREYLRANLSTQMEALYLAIYAVVLILVVLFRPQGIATIFEDAYARLTSRLAGDQNVA
jgi:branched-chain amino acid transport system permease protein